MSVVHIYTSKETIDEVSAELLEQWVDSNFEDKTFIVCENNTDLLTNDEGTHLMTMEFAEE